MKPLSDTSPGAERVWIECYRRMPPERKFALLEDANRTAWFLHRAGFLHRNPGSTPEAVQFDWVRLTLGERYARLAKEGWLMQPLPTESLRVTREVMEALRRLGVPCALGGSFATTVHGIARQTQDADVSAEPFPGKETALIQALGPDYYISESAVREAIRNRSSFNIIHTPSAFKVDVFIRKDRPFDESLMRRRSPQPLSTAPADVVDVVSPEDIVLLKLEWYRLGGETSDRQWGDVQGVLKVQAGRLDEAYLDHWAAQLGVADLLARARAEAALP